MAMSILAGCSLLELDEAKDNAEAVAVIPSITTEVRVKQPDGKYVRQSYTTEERVITKAQLIALFNNNASQYSNTEPEEIFEDLLSQLIDNELLLIEAERLIFANEIVIKQKEYNDIWKQVYDRIDEELYKYEKQIAKEYEQDIYEKGQTVESNTKYPVLQKPFPLEEDEEEDEDIWTPENNRGPVFNYEILNNGTAEQKSAYFRTEEYLQAARKTEALKRYFEYIRENYQVDLLTKEQRAEFDKDFEKVDAKKGLPIWEYAKLYYQMKDFWFVKNTYYEYSYKSMLLEKLKEYAQGEQEVSDKEIRDFYNSKLAEQRATYSANINDYINAMKSNEIVLYHPANTNFFYVKHILISFTQAQLSDIALYKKSGKSDEQVQAYREKLANSIMLYEHRDGYDYGKPMSLSVAENDIYNSMRGKTGLAAEQEFERLIYKYNVDDGMFNNFRGYGMQYKDKESADYIEGYSGYVAKFEEASNKLYEQYLELKRQGMDKRAATGLMSERVVSEYGVHYIMFSQAVNAYVIGEKAELESNYTNIWGDLGDRERSQSYYDALKTELNKQKKNEAFNKYSSQIVKKLRTEWGDSIKTFPKKYAKLVKEVEKASS